MIFIGDVHGKISQYRNIIRELEGPSIQVGDMGLGFKGVRLYPEGCMASGKHKFIRGNHDSPQECMKHRHYLGHWGVLKDGDRSIFYLGGAWSIDQQWRIPGISWWPDEELSQVDLHAAYMDYCNAKPDIVATHEAPSNAAFEMVSNLTIESESYKWNKANREYNATDSDKEKGEEYQYFKSKLGCINTRTSQYLQQMFDVHQPKHWVFGHYHVRRDFDIKGCHFHCIPELGVLEL
jgi:hypothetical protein